QPDRKVARAETPKQNRAQGVHLDKAPDGRVQDRNGQESLSGNGRALAMAETPQGQPQQRGPEGIPGLQPGAAVSRGPLTLTIDMRGELKDVHVTTPSGVTYLDEVAVDSFRRAERFPNPPPGLFNENGTATMGFGFVLGLARGFRMRMGPAYLPNSPAQRGY